MINFNKLKRDSSNQAIINSDIESYKIHLTEVKKSRDLNQTMKDVKKLKEDIDEIKDMLRLILDLKKNG